MIEEKIICNYCNEKIATWFYMPSTNDDLIDHFYCEDCVPRGCSCNNEILYEDEDIEEMEYELEKIKKEVNSGSKYILVNYGQKEHERGKEIEEIKDENNIINIINNSSIETMLNFELKPLDEKNREYPCCEFDYSENGYLKKEFFENE